MKTCCLGSAVVLTLLDGCSGIALWSLLPQKSRWKLEAGIVRQRPAGRDQCSRTTYR
jgi:hypothetical protein